VLDESVPMLMGHEWGHDFQLSLVISEPGGAIVPISASNVSKVCQLMLLSKTRCSAEVGVVTIGETG